MNCESFMKFYCFVMKLMFHKSLVKLINFLRLTHKKHCILCGMIIVLPSQKNYICKMLLMFNIIFTDLATT